MKDILNRIGQLFMVGFAGNKPPDDFIDFVKQEQLGGIILFEDNCGTYGNTRENIEILRACYRGTPPFVAIDQEGGRVCRLRGMPAEFRSAETYGREKDVEHFIEDYSRAAVYLESLGINLNLAPVADIASGKNNPCLEGRCFAADAGTVSLFVEAMIKVSKAKGLLTCAKHFPGLGSATNDPHKKTAVALYDEIIWQQREKIPFQAAVETGVDFIMTTHLHLPKIDDTIVTGSSKIISGLIRQILSFDGPIMTDDLTMVGATALGDIEERTVKAFLAGHDILLFGQDFQKARKAYNAFVEAYREGEITEERINDALNRVMGIKFKLKMSVIH